VTLPPAEPVKVTAAVEPASRPDRVNWTDAPPARRPASVRSIATSASGAVSIVVEKAAETAWLPAGSAVLAVSDTGPSGSAEVVRVQVPPVAVVLPTRVVPL
jgi:hypothetical protein